MDKCSNCNFIFKETSVQFYRRLKNNSPKICRECSRIATAEQKALKREKQNRENEYFSEIKNHYADFGKISRSVLMRKFKLNYQEADKIAQKYENTS